MKIERMNDNQFRCTLSSFDLSSRDLNLGELAYGSEKAKKLFQEMIQKASREVGFDAEDMPIMVEAIPLSTESIMLIITKIEDPEELDTRFSKFSPMTEEENPLSLLANELLEGADGLLELFTQGASGKPNTDSAPSDTPNDSKELLSDSENKTKDDHQVRFFSFDSLEAVCRVARIAGPFFDGPNALYKNPSNNRFYLVLHEANQDTSDFNRTCNLLNEYSTALKTSPATEAYYQEHYEIIVQKAALQTLSAF